MSRQFTPTEAVERYIKERESDLSESTLYNYHNNLKMFLDWCSYQSDIEYVSDIDQFHISDFKLYKRDEGDVENTTLYNIMMSLRVFIKWCESKGLLEDIADSIILPERDSAARTESMSPKTAGDILDYLSKYEYATSQHVQFALLWDCGLRLGALRSLDVRDYYPDEVYVELHHRPEQDTPLKNGTESERQVNLHGWVTEIVDDHLSGRHPRVEDDYGRLPLIGTEHGRAGISTLRRRIYSMTRPCLYDDTCPAGRDISECEANCYQKARECPERLNPHAIRRASITAWLDDGHSKELVSDRMDVSPDVLEEHYDARSEEQKRKLRRDMFEMDESDDNISP